MLTLPEILDPTAVEMSLRHSLLFPAQLSPCIVSVSQYLSLVLHIKTGRLTHIPSD